MVCVGADIVLPLDQTSAAAAAARDMTSKFPLGLSAINFSGQDVSALK